MPPEENIDFAYLAQHSVDIICRVGMNRLMTYASPACREILGWNPEEMVGKGPEEFVVAEDLPIIAAASAAIVSPEVHNSPATVRMRRKDGSNCWIEMNARLVRNPSSGEPMEIIVTMRDVSERKSLEEQLSALARTDGLTGLLNRRAFDEAMAHEWSRTLREDSDLTLLLLDIDYFKRFNDQHGHQGGDDCLRRVAAAVRGSLRITDFVARYGGEEIAVILPATAWAGAVATAEKARSAVAALRLTHEGNQECGGIVTVSIGIASIRGGLGGTVRMPERLIQAADGALYKAKHAGRNRVSTAPPLTAEDQ